MRRISLVIITCYLSLITQSVQAAIQQEVFARPKPNTDHSTPVNQLEQMRELMRQLHNRQLIDAKPSRSTALVQWQTRQQQQEKSSTESLLALQDAVLQEGVAQEQQLQATEKHIKDKNLPASILKRHQVVLIQLQERRQQLQNTLHQLAKAQQQNKTAERKKILDVLSVQLEKWGGEQAQMTDAKHLPWGSPSSKVRAPLDSKQAYIQHLNDVLGVAPIRVAGALPSDMIWPVLPKLPAEVQATDTAENEDVQFTPAIQAKAAELNHNPAQIYKWVYDNIEYVPTYGSIQGADFTLQSKRGNAFDTSSLLIALLRASNVPARYVYGTIEVPAKQLLNWVGGVNTVDAAQNLMGQGGIPNVALTQGGQDIAVRMEHVWVEAYVDFVPSRGVVNRIPDTWIPLDASSKQYAYTSVMNLAQAVPFDAQTLISAAQQGATINEAVGYVQNINQQEVQSVLVNYQARLKAYVEQQSEASLDSLLGAKVIKHYMARGLSNGLQYKVTAVAGDYHTLPNTMRHYFTVQIFQNGIEQQMNEPSIDLKISTAKLAGKAFALSFKASSLADEQTINSYLPHPHADGSPIQPSELPRSMAGYLIHLTPELTLNGEVLTSIGEFMMGQEVTTRLGYASPNNTQHPLVTKIVRAGEYHAIGVDLQGISQQQLMLLQGKVEQIQSVLNDKSVVKTSSLTKHDVTGVPLQLGVQLYFALNDYQNRVASRFDGVVSERSPSFGTFSTKITPNLAYGFPLSAKYNGMLMDIDSLSSIATDKNNDHSSLVNFMASNGARASMNESSVVEDLFRGSDEGSTHSICAAKALQLAMKDGQKIFNIRSDTLLSTIPQLNQSASVLSDIRNAVNAGKEVTISQGVVRNYNWAGVGYIIYDPETGSGAYLIAGGSDGSDSNSYMDFVSTYAITSPETLAALLFLVVPKSWFGFNPLLGSTNAYTSVIRGLSLYLYKNVGFAIPYAKPLGRFWILTLVAVFIGFYNTTVLIEGLFYANIQKSRRPYVV